MEFHVDDYAKGRYDTTLAIYLLTDLGLNLNFSDHVIEAYDVPLKSLMESMVDLGEYEFKNLNTGKITPK